MVSAQQRLRLGHILRLGSFHIGSAMGDILVTSIWNRILIVNYGIPAAPVSLLIALRYLLSPLSLWAGHFTDSHRLFGLRRTPLIWIGRASMVLALPVLGLSVVQLGESSTSVAGWALALASSLMYGIGTLLSGSPFLALVRDSVPESKQGLAIASVETLLIVFFAISGITFSIWMPEYSLQTFWQMILVTMAVGSFFWFFAILGVEKRRAPSAAEQAAAEERVATGEDGLASVLRGIWADRRTRLFFLFLSAATLSAWMQDAILEPFGADVFNLELGVTTRFNSYWQAATVVTLIGSNVLWRKRPPERQGSIAGAGLLTMTIGMLILTAAAFSGQRRLIEAGLLVFGAGFGVYSFGGLSLMAVMSPSLHAGAYLGLWTISVLVFKGLGTFAGGALRDVFLLSLGLRPGASYALVFVIAAAGLAGAAFILRRVDVLSFAADTGRHVDLLDVQLATAD